MIVSIMQPAYMPWLGYFHRLAQSDVHVVLDSVFVSNGGDFFNRNRVRTVQGWTWLTVPIASRAERATKTIRELRIDNSQPWAAKHWKTIEHSYGRAKHFDTYAGVLREAFARPYEYIEDLCTAIVQPQLEALKISPRLVYSSDMKLSETKSELILRICEELGASTYISGPFGRTYLDADAFARSGIELRYHDYVHPTYEQNVNGFEPYMAAIDLLFNYGEESRGVLTAGQPELATA